MSEMQHVPEIYVHERRPEWGVAILAEDCTTRRRYLFQDGRLRSFKRGFFHMFRPADKPLDVARRVARKLGAKVDKVIEGGQPARRTSEVSLKDQTRVFRKLFPGGFHDPAYMKKYRSNLGGRRRKSHADAAIADARRLLARDRMQAHLDADAPAKIYKDAVALMDAVHFCKTRDKGLLRKMRPARQAEFGEALFGLVHDDAPFFDRFARLMNTLETRNTRPSWTLATMFSGLAFPNEHVIVTPRAFDQQARWMAPSLLFELTPSAGQYDRLRRMAHNVRDALEERDFNPRDMLDIHHFVVSTLRPKALKMLAKSRAESSMQAVAA